MITGALLVLIALFWGQFFPVAKKLWTSPFVLLTIGIDLVLLGLLIFCIEIKQWRRGIYFFQGFGKNPLAIFLLSELLLTFFLLGWVRPRLGFFSLLYHFFFWLFFPHFFVYPVFP